MALQIAFVDTRLADWQMLVGGLDSSIEVILLDAERDGVLQIAAALEGRSDVGAIHIFSHGSSGALYLGDTVLREDNLDDYASSLAAIGRSLTETGDILLYGCNVAASAIGEGFIVALAQATGADIAASSDLSGAQARGGDWVLEVSTGPIEFSTASIWSAVNDYAFTLASITGTAGDDSLVGTSGNDFLGGLAGDDTLRGLDGNDNLDGGAGNDLIDGGAGYDLADYYFAPSAITLNFASGTVTGGYGNDTLIGIESVRASNYGDTLLGDASANNFLGEAGNDTIIAGDGADALNGGAGDDSLDGGAGTDSVSFGGATGPVVANLATGIATGGDGNDTLVSIEEIRGSNFGDTFTGNAEQNFIDGGGGDDLMMGGENHDSFAGNSGNDTIDGGPGEDGVTYTVGPGPVSVNLAAGTASGAQGDDTLIRVENVAGTTANDTLIGNDDANRLMGLEGDDSLSGGGGDDLLEPGPGNDTIDGGLGGRDTVQYTSPGPVVVDLAQGLATGPEGNDTLANVEVIIASNFDDILVGNASDNLIWDQLGNDTVYGGAGNDILKSGNWPNSSGADSMIGGTGNDEFWVDDPGDIVVELPGEGTDGVVSSISITLPAYVELSFYSGPPGGGITGNALDNTITGNEYDNALDGAGGVDTVSYAYSTSAVTVDIGQRQASGSGSDSILNFENAEGGSAADTLTGDSGANVLIGRRGADTMAGGFGNDVYYVDDVLDVVQEISNAVAELLASIADGPVDGITDTVVAAIDYSLASLADVENLTLSNDPADSSTGTRPSTGTGNTINNVLTGNDVGNTLTGLAGNDTLEGGAGADTLSGGPGDDTYLADASDTLLEVSGEGTDGVRIELAYGGTFALADHFENVTLTGSAYSIAVGNAAANLIVGNGVDNDLYGRAGNDSLNGGAGADWMYGGADDDTYTVDGQADLVFEFLGEGADTVIASANFYLYAGIERLILASGTGDIFGSANELDNTLVGNEGVNLLLGWDGSDTISGGEGSDLLYGVNGADALYGEAGIDVLVGGGANDTLDGGTDADLLAGEDGDDVLYGGAGFFTDILVGGTGNDTLDGSASVASGQLRNAGDYDRMDGGANDDTYIVDTPDDLTFEAAGGGTDRVIADISGAGYYLYPNVENLTLQGPTPYGVGNDLDNALTGSSLSNWLLGGSGNDMLNGKGNGKDADGNNIPDVLFGETGSDTFVFERGTGADVIGDFTPGTDKIQLVGIGYTNVTEVKAHMDEAGGVSAIDLGLGDIVVLHNVTIASLSAGDFIFA